MVRVVPACPVGTPRAAMAGLVFGILVATCAGCGGHKMLPQSEPLELVEPLAAATDANPAVALHGRGREWRGGRRNVSARSRRKPDLMHQRPGPKYADNANEHPEDIEDCLPRGLSGDAHNDPRLSRSTRRGAPAAA